MHSGVGLGQGKRFGGRGSEHFRGSRTESHEEDAPNISTVLFLIVFYSSSIVWFQKLSPHPHPQRVPFKQNLRPPPPPQPHPLEFPWPSLGVWSISGPTRSPYSRGTSHDITVATFMSKTGNEINENNENNEKVM